jgi:hypothetical protein
MSPRRESRRRAVKKSGAGKSNLSGAQLIDAARNQLQKTVLLRELNNIRRDQIAAAIEDSKRLLEQSKKLCSSKAKNYARAKQKTMLEPQANWISQQKEAS